MALVGTLSSKTITDHPFCVISARRSLTDPASEDRELLLSQSNLKSATARFERAKKTSLEATAFRKINGIKSI
jgi:hypothetical protein